MKKAVFPGSFDPITLGHYEIILRGAKLFDELIVGIGSNADKKYMFPLNQRIQFVKNTFKDINNITVEPYEGLTIDFCKVKNANYILRGLRSSADFEYEKQIAQANNYMSGSIETIMLLTSLNTSFISSGIVRDVIRNNGDYTGLVPDTVKI